MNTVPRAKDKTGEVEYVTHEGKHLRQDMALQGQTPSPSDVLAPPSLGMTSSMGAETLGDPPPAWAQFEDDNKGLLTQDTKEWAHFTDSSSKLDTSSVSSEDVEDVWTITAEQRDYYINQFKTMQPDVRGVISGATAKDFFEKSRLPVQELSKIWQLADVNRDGALSLEEFCTAMHLVVLRRNDIELPDHLPPPLIPYVPLNPDEPFAADLPPGSTIMKKPSPIEASPAPTANQQWTAYRHSTTTQDSPTSSSISSPGSKPTPVNFDYKPIIADAESQIVHPVALRMSPDGHTTVAVDAEDPSDAPLPTFMDAPMQGRPRPTPKKALSVPGPEPRLLPPRYGADQLPERPTTLHMSESTPAAPQLPQRPKPSHHARASSLDSQLIDFSEASEQQQKQAMTQSTTQESGDRVGSPPPPGDRDHDQPPITTSTPAKGLIGASLECKELREAIRKQQLKNAALNRVNNELNQELQEMMEQRIALEIQLEHLRPITMGKGQFFVNLI